MPDITNSSSSPTNPSWNVNSHDREDDEVPQLPPFYSPRPLPVSRAISELDLNSLSLTHPSLVAQTHSHSHDHDQSSTPPRDSNTDTEPEADGLLPDLVSPAFTPPSTPGTGSQTPSSIRPPHVHLPKSVPVDSSTADGGCGQKKPKLLDKLPDVNCVVRARIPTTIGGTGTEMFLHLYQNSEDNKEHLAIVFGNTIRSQSLDRVRDGETEMDRLIRGAYTGRLYPGRTTSSMVAEGNGAKVADAKNDAPLVRIHSECYTGETVWSARCDCGEQLDEAARLMSLPGSGGGVRAVEGPGREVVVKERVAMVPLAWRGTQGGIRSQEVGGYLKTKIEKMGHMLQMAESS
ncbi:related to GTP cyclohydrolase II [Rhynchosporium secalis]|uniref:Related to GTP cyclohydrolase II n=1 Tax=Rhynchosporium secalis TaxID=38038 RepID=A0A1E1LU47_RHYSE|nr:related to GTP cyclohydrolase II [Rhynchosporium secalis]